MGIKYITNESMLCNEFYSISLFHPEHYKLTVAADTSSAGVQEYREDNEKLMNVTIVRRGCRRG